jgi:type II secretory pathway component GspD/PulD (secretin)
MVLAVGAFFGVGESGQSAAPGAGQAGTAQTQPAQAPPSAPAPPAEVTKKAAPQEQISTGTPIEAGSLHARRKAAKLYLQGVKLLEKKRPEDAWKLMKQAAVLDPGNLTYAQASELARQSAVTQLVEQASRVVATPNESVTANDGTGTAPDRPSAGPQEGLKTTPEATKLLEHALEIDPQSPEVLQHMNQMADEVAKIGVGTISSSISGREDATKPDTPGEIIRLEHSADKHSFHLRSNSRQVIQEVFRAYGIEASVNDSVQSRPLKFDLDDATFADATKALEMATNTFHVPLDPQRAIVAKDSREFRTQFQRLEMETVYLPGLTDKELTDVGDLARNLFDVQQAVPQPSKSTLTLRAPTSTLQAFNRTIGPLEAGRNQVDLDMKVIELSHITSRETGVTAFQQTGVYNLASEANSIINQNQAAVQEIIASGLVPNSNGLANQEKIILLLLAAGQLTGPPFNQGLLLFGNGISASILAVSPATLTMTLNSSDTRTLDDIHMRLSDDETGTFKTGERYPIETSSFSSVALPAIAGLSSAVASAESQTIPQIQYEDLGLTLKATPKVLRSDEVALTIDLKIEALGGTALNDIPILDSRAVSGVLTLKAGETAVMLSELSRSESRAMNGLPGLGDIPGLQDINDIARDQNISRLMILLTPRVIRETQLQAKGRPIPIDKGAITH